MEPVSNNRFAGKLVLLAEDEPVVRNYVRHVLTKMGFRVMDGSTAEEVALSRGFPGKIDLLVTNVKMPGMNGVELANRLREERPETRAIIMSGHTSGILEQRWQRAGFLAKPFLPEALAAKVSAVLETTQTQSQSHYEEA